MADIEKVIKGLECCCKLVNGMGCNNCQYGEECNDPDALECVSSLTYDALELLKDLKPEIKRETKAVMTREKAREILNILPRCKECDGTFPYNLE